MSSIRCLVKCVLVLMILFLIIGLVIAAELGYIFVKDEIEKTTPYSTVSTTLNFTETTTPHPPSPTMTTRTPRTTKTTTAGPTTTVRARRLNVERMEERAGLLRRLRVRAAGVGA